MFTIYEREGRMMGGVLHDEIYIDCLASGFGSPVLGRIFSSGGPQAGQNGPECAARLHRIDHEDRASGCDHRGVQLFVLVQVFVIVAGLLCGMLLASGVYRGLGWRGVVGLVSLSVLLTAVLSAG